MLWQGDDSSIYSAQGRISSVTACDQLCWWGHPFPGSIHGYGAIACRHAHLFLLSRRDGRENVRSRRNKDEGKTPLFYKAMAVVLWCHLMQSDLWSLISCNFYALHNEPKGCGIAQVGKCWVLTRSWRGGGETLRCAGHTLSTMASPKHPISTPAAALPVNSKWSNPLIASHLYTKFGSDSGQARVDPLF
ncbi:Basic region leucine zipper [Musa troglodytarum]|uniref:Basic region leucine zipper n=1 Tax=Musa troglodytarum TaxID=320322 RepID=A0A9E7HX09_9LILI|nr:Basic region leucine zipper [Musa troglodytarum]